LKEKLFDCFAILAQGKEDAMRPDKNTKPYINFTYPINLQKLQNDNFREFPYMQSLP
jgi:hypothetical protein